MSNIFIATAPRDKVSKREVEIVLESTDPKKWIIAKEIGRGGYRHWQIRVKCSGDLYENCQKMNLNWHVEKSQSWSSYERKEANFWCDDDSTSNLIERYGEPEPHQKHVLKVLQSNDNRQVTIWYDPEGNNGKSWLGKHLWETGKAHYTRFTGKSAEMIVKDVCSKMSQERRPIVVIDIPRSAEWKDEVYETIEVVKDGLIDDPRYSATSINISGVKVLVTCNTKPNLNALSKDRWIFVRARRREQALTRKNKKGV